MVTVQECVLRMIILRLLCSGAPKVMREYGSSGCSGHPPNQHAEKPSRASGLVWKDGEERQCWGRR
jgi:hypothetical protein